LWGFFFVRVRECAAHKNGQPQNLFVGARENKKRETIAGLPLQSFTGAEIADSPFFG
jgi:hypothetical protein